MQKISWIKILSKYAELDLSNMLDTIFMHKSTHNNLQKWFCMYCLSRCAGLDTSFLYGIICEKNTQSIEIFDPMGVTTKAVETDVKENLQVWNKYFFCNVIKFFKMFYREISCHFCIENCRVPQPNFFN